MKETTNKDVKLQMLKNHHATLSADLNGAGWETTAIDLLSQEIDDDLYAKACELSAKVKELQALTFQFSIQSQEVEHRLDAEVQEELNKKIAKLALQKEQDEVS